MYTNDNSLGNKQDELKCRVQEINPDVIGITEVWQKEVFVMEGYHQAFRKDRSDDQVGGGVMLLVCDSCLVSECTELNEMCFEESVWCILNPSREVRILVGVCYRSPSSTPENNEKLINIMHHASKVKASHLLLMGDFNYGQIDWDTGVVPGPDDSNAKVFYEKTQDLFLYQHVTVVTAVPACWWLCFHMCVPLLVCMGHALTVCRCMSLCAWGVH